MSIDKLTLEINKATQAQITTQPQQISDLNEENNIKCTTFASASVSVNNALDGTLSMQSIEKKCSENEDKKDVQVDKELRQNNEDEDDEDVREARRHIKAHLERIRQTEEFLRGVQVEEENFERQRQANLSQITFDSMLLSSRLRSTTANNLSNSNNRTAIELEQNNYTAPVAYSGINQTTNCFFPTQTHQQTNRNRFLSIEREFSNRRLESNQFPSNTFNSTKNIAPQPFSICSSYTKTTASLNEERPARCRCKSQLRVDIDSNDIDVDLSYKPMSCTSALSFLNRTKTPFFATYDASPSSMSPSSSSLIANSSSTNATPMSTTTRARRSNSLLERQVYSISEQTIKYQPHDEDKKNNISNNNDEDQAIDAEMDAYRPPAYIPQTSIASLRLDRSRSRTKSNATSWISKEQEDKVCDKNSSKSTISSNLSQSSKLSALEERINERKKRTAELFAENKGGHLSANHSTNQLENCQQLTKTTTNQKNSDNDRSESIESRIRRKSYCVKLTKDHSATNLNASGAKLSLEKWRESRRASLTASSLNQADSLAAKKLLVNATRLMTYQTRSDKTELNE